jgi:hypothetical protein
MCGVEPKLRLTRQGPDARHDGWSYLFGKCRGGVKLRFNGAKVVEWKHFDDAEGDRVRALPAPRLNAYETMLERLDDRQRVRLDAIVTEIRDALREGMTHWLAIGKLLVEAKQLLKKGDFGTWVERNGMDRHNAHRLMSVFDMATAAPAFSSTFRKIGQEKTVLLTRLTEAKRLEVLEHGVPIGGTPKPLDEVTFRELNTYVRSIVGKSARGRKGKAAPAEKPTHRFGLPIGVVEAFQAIDKGFEVLREYAKHGIDPKPAKAMTPLWRRVNRGFFRLQDDHGFAKFLEAHR